MKALFFQQHGPLSNLQFGELPDPKPRPGHALVRVRACAINHLDLWVLLGWPGLKLEMPHIGGADIAGEILEVNGECAHTVGSRVALMPGFLPAGSDDEYTRRGDETLSPSFRVFGEHIRGGFAELVEAPVHTLLPIPDRLSFSQACAPLLVATTAWRMLRSRAQLAKGETVLIVGAGGGLNSFSIWLAKDLGARVIALTSSEDKMRRAKGFGADDVVNYREHPDWSAEVRRLTSKRGVDVVIDNIGGESFQRSLLALARGGRLITVGNTAGASVSFDNRLVFAKQLSIIGSTMGSAADTRAAAEYAWGKPLQSLIDRELPLREGASAYQTLEKGSQFGKVILLP